MARFQTSLLMEYLLNRTMVDSTRLDSPALLVVS